MLDKRKQTLTDDYPIVRAHATRQTGVLCLEEEVIVTDMTSGNDEFVVQDIEGVLESFRNRRDAMVAQNIMARDIPSKHRKCKAKGFKYLKVIFLGYRLLFLYRHGGEEGGNKKKEEDERRDDHENKSSRQDVVKTSRTYIVLVPMQWTPELYLAAINRSVQKSGCLLLERFLLNGIQMSSINDIHHHFHEDISALSDSLLYSSLYYAIKGGQKNLVQQEDHD